MDFNQLQARLGMQFHNPALLEQALTHSSYRNENPECKADNERLEFLGDAVLDLVTARYLYEHHPALQEGELTRLRAALVRTEQLAELARSFELGKALRVGRGESETGGRARDTLLCCAFEAILGALYLDSGEAAVCDWVEPLLAQQSAIILTSQAHIDSKSELQEWAQANGGATPVYNTIDEQGPDHAKQFTVQVLIAGKPNGTGSGRSKQAAAQAAAQAALHALLADSQPPQSPSPTPDSSSR
ncbi:MAG: ribonuclease III [Chloroflexi bacterium]|nr:ribonuclease III [Chloroflexota bacterium]